MPDKMTDIEIVLAISAINQGETVIFISEADARKVFSGFVKEVRPSLWVIAREDGTITMQFDPAYLSTRPHNSIPVLNEKTDERDAILEWGGDMVILEQKGSIPFAELNADWRPWNR